MIRFEICANGYQSVVNAIKGGADCAELCEALETGGLTPSFGTLMKLSEPEFPIRVLIRCRQGNYIYNDDEIDIMCEDIKMVKNLGFEGVVIGALNAKGEIDIPAIKRMMKAGDGMKFTFHRAIDACKNPFEAMQLLIDLGFDKVLTSGCKPTAYEGVEMIREMQNRFGDKINVMAGGGINVKNVDAIIKETGIKNCHASLTSNVVDYHSDLYPDKVDATGADMLWKESEFSKIRMFKSVISNC